ELSHLHSQWHADRQGNMRCFYTCPTKIKIKIKGVGQDCPTHTFLPTRSYPEPAIVFWFPHQTTSHWILPNILQLFLQTLLGTQDMIEGFLLPDWAGSGANLVGRSDRRSLE